MPLHDWNRVSAAIHRDFHGSWVYAISALLNTGGLPAGYYALVERSTSGSEGEDLMPMHDWTRVQAGIYHHFHGRWIYAMSDAMNSGPLPSGYYALAEQITRQMGPDVLTLQGPTPPPADANGTADGTPGGHSAAALRVATAPPPARFAVTAKPKPRPRPQRRLTIRHIADHRMVAVIELVSPGNKSGRSNLRDFVGKAAGLLDRGLHLLVVDPFPPGRRDPNGVHAAIWEDLVGEPFALPPDKPLTLAAYAAGERVTAYVTPVAVGDPLPDMPLFLDAESYVNVPLEATYQAAWSAFPAEWKRVLTAPRSRPDAPDADSRLDAG